MIGDAPQTPWAILEAAVLKSEGALSSDERRAFAYDEAIAEPYSVWIAQVRRRAEGCTDAMVEDLKAEGQSEEAIFEATLACALGAGLSRLRAAQAALSAGGDG